MKLLGIHTNDLHNQRMAAIFVARLITMVVGLVTAVITGYWLGTGQIFYLTVFVGFLVVVFVALGMQRKAWILIPLTWILTGSVGRLPVPFAVRDLGILLATTSYVAYRVLSNENLRPKLHILDALVGINVIYLAFTLYVNPVGFAVFGAATVGARPILNIFLALMGYWVVIRLPNSVTAVSRIPYYMLVSAVFLSGLNVLLYVVPSLTPTIVSWYSGVDTSAYVVTLQGEHGGYQRLFGMMFFGLYFTLLLCAYYSPITLFDPRRGRFYAMLLALGAILLSGFRNMLLWAFAAFGISGWLHRRWRQLAWGGLVGGLLLLLLGLGQGRVYQLPLTMQRSLSFLPGDWSEAVVTDTENSSTWRFKLWKDIIEWHLIKDWWFGDGFGASAEDLSTAWRLGSYTEFAVLTGSFHNGPLTTIRYVGICGLVLLYLLSITAARYSYKCVNECRETPLFPVAIFFAIQLIWGPIHYTFVFGAYNEYLADLLYQVACLRLLFRMSEELKYGAAMKTRLVPVQSAAVVTA